MDSKQKPVREMMPPPSPGSDVNLGVIVKAGIVLLVVAVAVHVLMWVMFNYLHKREISQPKELSPLIPQQAPPRPEPRLQEQPQLDLEKIRGQEDQILHSYGWVDPEKGIVHMPIEEAMKLYVQKGEKQ